MDNRSNMLQLCRLCLVKDDVNIPIFEEHGDIRQIFLKITSCLPVKVSRDDKLPKKICDGCSYKLETLYEFWNTSVNAEKQLLAWLGEAGMNSEMADGTITAVAQQIKPTDTFVKQETVDPPDVHSEDHDQKDYVFQQKFESASAGPSATVTSNEEEEPPPKRARRTAAVKAAIAMDRDSDDDDDSGEPITKVEDESEESDGEDHTFADAPSTSADDQPGPSGVGKDGVDAPSRARVKKSLTTSSVKETRGKRKNNSKNALEDFVNLNDVTQPLICTICSKSSKDHLEHGLHSKTHSDNSQYTCHMCDFTNESKDDFKKHIKSHELYKCQKCDKILKTRLAAYKHSKSHSAIITVQCDICGKHLKKQCLYLHKRMLHAENKASMAARCPICGKEYQNPSSLRKHYSSLHREVGIDISVVCDICGMRLSSKATLPQHLRTHTGDKPFACDDCPKRFISKDILSAHRRIHTGEKPFECEFCGKKFAHGAPYRYHIKTHTGEKKHHCPICGKGFILKAPMKNHLKRCKPPMD